MEAPTLVHGWPMNTCVMGLVSVLHTTPSLGAGEDLGHTAPCLTLVVQVPRAAASLLAATRQSQGGSKPCTAIGH